MEGESGFRFGVKQRLYNWNLRVAREKMGLSQKEVAREVGVSAAAITRYEGLRAFPEELIRQRIARFFGVNEDSIFPALLKDLKMEETPSAMDERSISLEEATRLRLFNPLQLLSEDPKEEAEKNLMSSDLKQELGFALSTLKPREQRFIELRFGLSDGQERTYKEIGKELHVTCSRVAQIGHLALRKLRQPSRSRYLKSYMY